MPVINTPTKLKNEILSRLGSPVHTVEVTEDQVWRCIDRAVQRFTEYHPEGTNRFWSVMIITDNEATKGVIEFTQPITAITKVNNLIYSGGQSWNESSIYSAMWHQSADIIANMSGGIGIPDKMLVNFEAYEQFLELNKNMFYPAPDFHYNPSRKQLSIVDSTLVEGQAWIISGYVASTVRVEESILPVNKEQDGGQQDFFDPTVHSGINEGSVSPIHSESPVRYFTQDTYNNFWLQDYATALVKQQWAQNLYKYSGQKLPGGITVDSQSLKEEAKEEIKDLEMQLRKMEAPDEIYLM